MFFLSSRKWSPVLKDKLKLPLSSRKRTAFTGKVKQLPGSSSCGVLERLKEVLFVESAAHAKLFPKCKVMVHHGGSGTTSACAMSGVPAVATQLVI